MNKSFRPQERVIIHQPIGLVDLGSEFNANAPFRACRLCGALYQSSLDLKQYAMWLMDDVHDFEYKRIEKMALERRIRWEEIHNKREHLDRDEQIEVLSKLGWAMLPAAAARLAPYGIFPTGNMHIEIVDAMATAPRAPLHDFEQ